MSDRLRVHGALLAAAVFFSLNYIVSKKTMGLITPITFAWLRVAGAAIVLNLLPREHTPLTRADERQLVLYALLAVAINQTLFLGGLSLTSAHLAAIIIGTIPLFTLGAAIAIGRERATAAKLVGIALAAAGAFLVVGVEGFEGSRRSLAGTLMLLGNSFSYALYLVLSKPMMARVSARRALARMFAWATLLLVPVAIVPMLREPWATIPPRAWLGLLFVIALPTIGAYLLNAWALARADSSIVAAYTYVQPVLTALLAAIFLGERIGIAAVAAAAMIFTGLWLASRYQLRSQVHQPPPIG
ncbi:MAG TPA: DMT family transporter [Candidatus Dormibacteraeota bacterium]|nr:DMT family transporter [Candidatus Dormibacteraeota bacterium]